MLCICAFMTYRKKTQSWLWTLLAISGSCACMQSFWLQISGKRRLESRGLPSKTFEMLQKWPARDGVTRSLVSWNILCSWCIVNRVKWALRGWESTTWIVTCDWWLLSQPLSLSFFSFGIGSMLTNLCTFKLDLQSPQWRNTMIQIFIKLKLLEEHVQSLAWEGLILDKQLICNSDLMACRVWSRWSLKFQGCYVLWAGQGDDLWWFLRSAKLPFTCCCLHSALGLASLCISCILCKETDYIQNFKIVLLL